MALYRRTLLLFANCSMYACTPDVYFFSILLLTYLVT